MRKLFIPVVMLIAIAIWVFPLMAAEETITGEVVDPACHLKGMAKGGVKHKECAKVCNTGGVTLAIAEEGSGKLYWALPVNPGQSPDSMLKGHVADVVKVKGKVFKGGEANGIVISTVEHISESKIK